MLSYLCGFPCDLHHQPPPHQTIKDQRQVTWNARVSPSPPLTQKSGYLQTTAPQMMDGGWEMVQDRIPQLYSCVMRGCDDYGILPQVLWLIEDPQNCGWTDQQPLETLLGGAIRSRAEILRFSGYMLNPSDPQSTKNNLFKLINQRLPSSKAHRLNCITWLPIPKERITFTILASLLGRSRSKRLFPGLSITRHSQEPSCTAHWWNLVHLV